MRLMVRCMSCEHEQFVEVELIPSDTLITEDIDEFVSTDIKCEEI